MNGKPMRNKIFFLLLMLLTAMHAAAQPYAFRAALPFHSHAGFYKVIITPEITAHSTAGLQDLRIRDMASHEVPYLLKTDSFALYHPYHPFAIISNARGSDGHTHIILRNDVTNPIEE